MRTILIYKDKRKEWRWKLLATRGGKCLADSGEGYKKKSGAKKAALNVFAGKYLWQIVFE